MRRHVPVLLPLIAALLLAACGGPGGQNTETGGAEEVSIEGFTYVPESVEVSAGTEITWTNEDDFAHTVTSGTPGEETGRFDGVMGEIGEMNGKGETFSFTFEEPGTYEYLCRFHPQQMRATVTVTE